MTSKNTKKQRSVFFQWILNNKFSVLLLDILLILLIIFLFTKVDFIFAPVNQFIGIVAPPIMIAAVMYYLMNPVVVWCEKKWHIHKLWTISVLFVLLFGLLALLISSLIPYIQSQFASLFKNWPTYWENLQDWVKQISQHREFEPVKKQLTASTNTIMSSVAGWFKSNFATTFSNIGGAVSTVTTVIINLVTAPFILFFMLKDNAKLKADIVKLAPVRWRATTKQTLEEINDSLSSYIRGQLTVAFWVFVMFSVGYLIIGQRYAVILGVIAGFCNLIPYVGSALAMIPSLIIGGFDSTSMLIKVIIVFFIEQTIEGRIVSPLVMGSKLEMHPVTTIIVLLAAGNLFGFLGVLLGIPGYAVLKILVTRIWGWLKQISGMYNEASLPEPAQPSKSADNGDKTK